MNSVIQWLRFNSVATASALLFYLFILSTCLVPWMRKNSWRWLSLPESPNKKPHISVLDTIRGAAAALVVLAHIWNFCTPIFNATQQEWWWFLAVGGNKAVPIFVILSGFLIFRTVKQIHSMDDLTQYIKRRFYRIYPVYLFTVLLGFLLRQIPCTLSNFLSNVFMIRSIYPSNLLQANPLSWSLYIEILFYLILPIWVVAYRNRAILAALVTFSVLLFVDPLGGRELWLWKYFFIGIIASELSDYLKTRISEFYSIVIFAMGMTLLIMDFNINRQGEAVFDWFNALKIIPKNHAEYTIGLAAAIFLMLIGSIHSKWIGIILGIKPLRVLGTVSYSLFLIHPFFILAVFSKLQFTEFGAVQHLIDPIVYTPAWYLPFVMFPGCLFWAMVCFVVVERPFLLKSRKKANPGLSLPNAEVSV